MLSLLKLVGRPLLKVLFSVEYHGLENVPASGAVILAGNHPSYLDPVLVALPISRVVRFMAWDALFRVPLLGPLIRSLGAFPVDIRRGKGEAAYREACRVLERGEALGIFPEGQRSDQGPMGELRTGVARLAIETGAPIVPITIGGASRAWPKWKLLPRPAKIIIRYHEPIRIDESYRLARGGDRDFHQKIMKAVEASINRSLGPALRGAAQWERLYGQPPSHVRSYELAPLIAALGASFAAYSRSALARHWMSVWLPALAYYLYLAIDLSVVKPSRLAKWLRNSMPVWLIVAWHYPLVEAIGAPAGEMNWLTVAALIAAFFSFFWEDYFTLQKFVRGVVVVYYCSLALMLGWPHALGLMVSLLGFVAFFSLFYRTVYYRLIAALMIVSVAGALLATGAASFVLLIYAALAIAALGYLQTFIKAAYDIRRAGDVSLHRSAARARSR